MSVFLDLTAPMFTVDQDNGDEHAYQHPLSMTECPDCGAQREPEPSAEERKRLWADPSYIWTPPEGYYLRTMFGLAGGGYGIYVTCDRCGFFHKSQNAG